MLDKIIVTLSLVTLLFLTGCASIVSKSEYPVTVSSKPSEVMFRILDSEGQIIASGKTPAVVNLRSGNGFFISAKYVVKFEKEGYQPAVTNVNGKIDGWYFGNLIFGGPIGLLIDPATGAMWKIDKNVYVELLPNE